MRNPFFRIWIPAYAGMTPYRFNPDRLLVTGGSSLGLRVAIVVLSVDSRSFDRAQDRFRGNDIEKTPQWRKPSRR